MRGQKKLIKNIRSNSTEIVDDRDEYQVMTVSNADGRNEPITVVLDLNEKAVRMEVNTGAAATLMTQNTFRNINDGNLTLNASDHKIIDYSGNIIPVEGSIDLPVRYQEQVKILPAIVVSSGSDLLGRNWLCHLKFDWNKMFAIKTVGEINTNWPIRYPQVFSNSLGKYTGPKAHIAKLPDCNPVFLRERTLPLAIRAKVKQTIEDMVKEGILTPTENSQWATPIVPVLKPDGSVRVCGDYRQTVNKSTACQTYPLPTLNNMLFKLSQGTIFSKLDLSQAYLQLTLDEETIKCAQ